MIKKALGTLMLLMTSHTVLADSGTDMANTLASDLINAANGAANGTQAGNAESSLGVSASSIGGPSASQANDMGVSGSSESQFHFVLKLHCKVGITQNIISLDGTRISVSCQGVGQWVSLLLCTPNERINCNTQAQYQRVSVPVNGTDMHVGAYHLKALCKDGYCTGALSKTTTITANSGNLDQKAQIAAQNNGVYQTVKTGYLGKNGYSKTQAYMHSFTSTGSNSGFAQCALGVKGYIASGVYYSCDGKAKDGFGAGCHSVTSCTQYSYHKHTDTTHKTCDITPGNKKVNCTKVPVVTIKKVPFTKPVPNPCTHIVVLNAQSSPPKGAKTLASFTESRGFWYSQSYNVYQVIGQSPDKACYLPGTLHVEHDRNQHGVSQLNAIGKAIYLFYAQAVYVDHWGVGDLHVKENGKVIAHVQSGSNTGAHSTSIVAGKDSTYVLDGVNWGFDREDFANAYSIYWAATPAHQEIKTAVVTWQQHCPEGT